MALLSILWTDTAVTFRNILHIVNNNASKFDQAASFKLKNFKLEVGKCSTNYCLYLITGYTKLTFGFDKKDLLEVSFKKYIRLHILNISVSVSRSSILLGFDHCID